MEIEALKAIHLLEETDCYHCSHYYYDKCRASNISVCDSIPEELHCMAFEDGEHPDAEKELRKVCNQEMKIGIDKMIMDIVNGN